MKKKLMFIFALLASTISLSHAEGIGDVSMRFCNQETPQKTLSLQSIGGQAQDICMEFTNQGAQAISIKLGFVDGVITNDSAQNKACKNEGETDEFGQYVKRSGTTINLEPQTSKRAKAVLTLPEAKAGEIHGCVTYFVQKQGNKNDMLNIMVRKASFIDIIVSGDIKLGFDFKNLTATYNKETKQIITNATIENQGNISENAIITGTIIGRFGYKKNFTTETKTIFPKQISNISATINELPWYGGNFSIQYNLDHAPIIENTNKKTITQETSIMIRNTTILIITGTIFLLIAIIITLTIIVLKKLKKQKTPTKHKKHNK